jgi:ketosteroid isomerase-like protein
MIGALITKHKVASAFRALNRRDVDAFLHDWREDATKVFPGELPISGEISGLMAMRDPDSRRRRGLYPAGVASSLRAAP